MFIEGAKASKHKKCILEKKVFAAIGVGMSGGVWEGWRFVGGVWEGVSYVGGVMGG